MITRSRAVYRVDSNLKRGKIEAGCDNLRPVVYCAAVAVF